MEDNSGHFPINRLRNVAIHNTITSHFWLTDVDIWPACHSPSLFSSVADLYETILSSPSTSKPSLFLSMRCYPSMSNWSALLTIAREYRLEVTIIQICRHVSSSIWSVRVRHRHLYAVPHHREELMSCLQFGPCEQFKKNRKTHVHFQQCIHQLVLHQLRAMGEDDKSIQVPLRCGVLQEWWLWTLCRCEARTAAAYPFISFNLVLSRNRGLTNSTSIVEWTSSFGSSGYESLITGSEFFIRCPCSSSEVNHTCFNDE